jgi:hypothetical protein
VTRSVYHEMDPKLGVYVPAYEVGRIEGELEAREAARRRRT